MLESIAAAVGLAPSRLWARGLLGVFPICPQTCFRDGRLGRAGLRAIGFVWNILEVGWPVAVSSLLRMQRDAVDARMQLPRNSRAALSRFVMPPWVRWEQVRSPVVW